MDNQHDAKVTESWESGQCTKVTTNLHERNLDLGSRCLSSSEWNARAGILQNWTQSLNPALMRRYEVSSRVNLVKNNDAACAEPVVREAAAGVPNY